MADKVVMDQRRSQGLDLAAVNAFTADVDASERQALRYKEPEEALRALAAATMAGTLRVPRLLVLDALVKFARRHGMDLDANDRAPLVELLTALVSRAGNSPSTTADAVAKVHGALKSVSANSIADPLGDSWAVFVQDAAAPLRLTEAEIEKPRCNDSETVHKVDAIGATVDAIGVTVEFHTDTTPGAMRDFCDPTHWHECSAYQDEMKLVQGGLDEPRPNGWRRELLEKVELAPGKKLETPLRFTYSIQAETDPRWVHLDYVLPVKTNEILVDEGSIDVRRVTRGKHKGRTRVTAKKAILFRNQPFSSWPSVACDTFWTDLVVSAAVGCTEDGGALPGSGSATIGAPQKAKLDKAIEEAAKSAQESIDAYTGIAKEAATTLGGSSSADPGAWLQLSAKTYARAAADSANAWSTWTEVLKILTSQAGSSSDE